MTKEYTTDEYTRKTESLKTVERLALGFAFGAFTGIALPIAAWASGILMAVLAIAAWWKLRQN